MDFYGCKDFGDLQTIMGLRALVGRVSELNDSNCIEKRSAISLDVPLFFYNHVLSP